MKKLDCHVHAWNLEQNTYAWLEGNTTLLNQTYEIEHLEEERNALQISAGVMVQAANTVEDSLAMAHQCRQYSWLKGLVGWLPLADEKAMEEPPAEVLTLPELKGIRHLIHDEPNPEWLLEPEVIKSFAFLVQRRLPFDVVAVLPEHLACVVRLSEIYPDMHWCIDHLGHPPIRQKERFGKWGEWMKILSGNPNVFIKISGLGMATSDLVNWQEEEIFPYIEFALHHFGTHRAMLGGDWPVVRLCGGLTKSWKAYEQFINRYLLKEEQENIYWNNGHQFYSLAGVR